MKHLSAYIAFMLILTSEAVSQQVRRDYLSPGVKIGYTLDGEHALVFGLECSFTRLKRGSYGAVVAVDFWRDVVRFHAGIEASAFVGAEWGPTLIVSGYEHEFTHTITLFGGFLAYPSYSITFRKGHDNLSEYGMYLKVPIRTAGPPFDF